MNLPGSTFDKGSQNAFIFQAKICDADAFGIEEKAPTEGQKREPSLI
jgi:hypothetical protein